MAERRLHEFLTLTQAASYLGVSRQAIYNWREQGLRPSIETPGGLPRFHPDDLDAFVESLRPAATDG